jgi:hypothetical protein
MISFSQTAIWRTDFGHGVRALSVFAGTIVIAMAVILFIFGVAPASLFAAARDTLGFLFLGLSSALLLVTIMALSKVRDPGLDLRKKTVWYQIGLHAANGIATVALTFTLFGISAGINQLAAGNVDIDTINQVVASLTSQFSMAFMTSVIGLPLSALMRLAVVVTGKREGF